MKDAREAFTSVRCMLVHTTIRTPLPGGIYLILSMYIGPKRVKGLKHVLFIFFVSGDIFLLQQNGGVDEVVAL